MIKEAVVGAQPSIMRWARESIGMSIQDVASKLHKQPDEIAEWKSTREVWNELERGEPHPYRNDWLKTRKHIFAIPTPGELQFVSTIFAIPHFQSLIGIKQQLRGTPVADPFVIAAAKVRDGTVVTEEALKPNASRIPNVCSHFNIPCINLENFMNVQGWVF